MEENWKKTIINNVIGIVGGLEEFGEMIPMSKFHKEDEIIYLFWVEIDDTCIFAKTDEKELQWQILTSIPFFIIKNVVVEKLNLLW